MMMILCLHLTGRYYHLCAKNKKGPKPLEHVQPLRMKQDHNKGFYSEKC